MVTKKNILCTYLSLIVDFHLDFNHIVGVAMQNTPIIMVNLRASWVKQTCMVAINGWAMYFQNISVPLACMDPLSYIQKATDCQKY